MNNWSLKILLVATVCFFYSCTPIDPNVNDSGKDELKSLEVTQPLVISDMAFEDIIYVPIYSDIYIDKQNQKKLLAATLSIRNTSYTDSLFVSKIDYFNTEGILVRSYLKKSISLPPMATVNYVVEKEDDAGGSGANFIIELSAKTTKIRPLVQAIMIESVGNKAFAFSTDGYSVK